MSIVRWSPFFNELEESFDRNKELDLAVDMYEEKGNIIAKMNIPGIDTDDISIRIHDHHLHISGKRQEKKEEKDKDYYYREIRSGSFERVISLPCAINESNTVAELHDGVLTLTMPKAAIEKKDEKRIKVIRR